MDIAFSGLDTFERTALLVHAISALRNRIPPGCESLKVEFGEQGGALIMAIRPDGGCVDVTLDDAGMSAAGLSC